MTATTNWSFTTRNAQLDYQGNFNADAGDVFYDFDAENDTVFIAANGTSYGQVYRVSASTLTSMSKTHKNDITASHDTKGIIVEGSYVYAAQSSARLYQMSATNLNELYYGSTSYTGSMLGLGANGSPFIIDGSGRLIGFGATNISFAGADLESGSFYDEVGALYTFGAHTYVGDMFIDMSNTLYLKRVYTDEIGVQGATFIAEDLDISGYCEDYDVITGIGVNDNDILIMSVANDTGVLLFNIGDDPMYYQTSCPTLTNAKDVAVLGNYAFIARDTTGIGLIEMNSGSNSRLLSESLSIGTNYYPTRVIAYVNGSGQTVVLVLAKYNTGSVTYLRSYLLN